MDSIEVCVHCVTRIVGAPFRPEECRSTGHGTNLHISTLSFTKSCSPDAPEALVQPTTGCALAKTTTPPSETV